MLLTASEYPSRTDLVASAIHQARRYYDIAKPKRIVSVGDGRWDLEVAEKLGIGFIGIGASAAADVLTSRGATVFADLRQAMPCPLEGEARHGRQSYAVGQGNTATPPVVQQEGPLFWQRTLRVTTSLAISIPSFWGVNYINTLYVKIN
ncbi:hypothetical protein [Cupriavidus basilensis]|uniref:hypothetical protein n=1 Tax=Cupriavidus basilensis TaxID=68895 RepID=UPI0039F6EF7A